MWSETKYSETWRKKEIARNEWICETKVWFIQIAMLKSFKEGVQSFATSQVETCFEEASWNWIHWQAAVKKGRGNEKAQRTAAINATSSWMLSDTPSLPQIQYCFDLSHIISFSCLLHLPCSQVSKSPTGRSSKSNPSIWETAHTPVIHTTYEAIRNRRN